ncbi:MAG TPA: aminotransferase class III-fold pyridoxal phosphate-dependent enzyme [Solirubrobacteraceae bacterium]|nr:aminotransferase class III-fold pyridoxal phosphate-dependent enzyme [Solirubrobacteraceae bacterium]
MTTPAPVEARSLRRSAELLSRGRKLIPGASQTLSKGPTQWVQGVAPAYVERAQGAHVWDVDGNRYLDFPMALGPIILGHRHPAVEDAIVEQLGSGISFTLPHPIEIEVAERILAVVPDAERVRFAKSGSDATSAAVRLARATTGRERVIVTGYHGWHDWYIGSTARHRGVPEAVRSLVEAVAFGDLQALSSALERWPNEIACVVCEPVGMLEPAPALLMEMIDLAHRHGALVVFDEVITGFRLAPGGAQEYFDVRADLVCFGKALGNGMPISALAGPASTMDALQDVFFSGTHGGETLSLAAARATLDVLAGEPVHEHLWRLGRRLQEGVASAIERHGLNDWVGCSGAAPWTIVSVREPNGDGATLPAKSLLQQEMVKRGVLFNGSNFISYAHTDADIDAAIEAYGAAFEVLAGALPDDIEARLEGPALTPAFRTPS